METIRDKTAMLLQQQVVNNGLYLKAYRGIQLQKVDIDGTDLLYSSDANMTGIPTKLKRPCKYHLKAALIKFATLGLMLCRLKPIRLPNERDRNVPRLFKCQ